MRVLVTGAAGMLGHEVLPALEACGHQICPVILCEDERGKLPALRSAGGHAPAQVADVTDHARLLRACDGFRPDWVFHLAARTQVDDCESHAESAFRVNGEGTRITASIARSMGAPVVFISTDYVFDGRGGRPYLEDDPPNPLSVYGQSKWAGEQNVRAIQPDHLIVRTAWLFGSGGANFIRAIVQRAVKGEALKVVDDQRGSPTWTRSLAGMLLALVDAREFGTYHCTNAGDCTWFDLARYAVERVGAPVAIEPATTGALHRPARRPAYSVLDNTRCERVTGMKMVHWHDAVNGYLASEAFRS